MCREEGVGEENRERKRKEKREREKSIVTSCLARAKQRENTTIVPDTPRRYKQGGKINKGANIIMRKHRPGEIGGTGACAVYGFVSS